VVKYSLSRYAARCLPLTAARERIRQAAFRAVKRAQASEHHGYEPPISLAVQFDERQVASYVAWMPASEYDGDRTVSYTDDDFLRVYKALLAMFWIAQSPS
jgi:D-aminopeptidase